MKISACCGSRHSYMRSKASERDSKMTTCCEQTGDSTWRIKSI